jgi:nitronate monooxygenase
MMPLPPVLRRNLRLPVIGAPLFLISNPALVVEQCKAGIIGSFPALNARPKELLGEWLTKIRDELAEHDRAHPGRPAAPYAVNLIVHKSNGRLKHDLATCVEHRVPVIITSLGVRPEVNDAVHAYGGLVLHDVITNRHAKSAITKGADGVIAVAAGAGGHTGWISPFALVQEIRSWFNGPLVLAGSIANGQAILAAQVMGADLAYVGSAFIATPEANAVAEYKQMLVDCGAEDIFYTNHFTGVFGNFLRPSLLASGLDPDHMPAREASSVTLAATSESEAPKTWKTIWAAGHGLAAIKDIVRAGDLVERLAREYAVACNASGCICARWTAAADLNHNQATPVGAES